MSRADRGRQHIARAERQLSWAGVWLGELRDHGRRARVADAERVMFAMLCSIGSSHDALASAANLLGHQAWCEQLHKIQSQDPLLRYLWLARHVEPSAAIVRWAPERTNATTQVVDAGRLQHITSRFFSPLSPHGASERLLMYAHGASTRHELKQKQGTEAVPDAGRLEAAGLEVVYGLQALELQGLEVPWGGRTEQVLVPDSHLGVKGDYGVADHAIDAGITFYRSKSDELTLMAAA